MRKCDCGGNARVYETRQQETRVRRRYECLACKERWSTVEQRAVNNVRDGRLVLALSAAQAAEVLELLRQVTDKITGKGS